VDSVEEVRGSNNVGADGIITTLKGIWLCVRTADCVPLFIYYPPEPLICAVHIGWRGLAKGIVERTIEILDNRFNIKKAYMHLFMGPAICQKHYPVKEDVVRFFPESVYIKNENSVYNLDIKKAIREKLYRFGVRGEQVFDIGWCTYENPELPSYRREKENLGSEIMNFCRLI
ncbi:MAG: polyphenol oxidase family protein, partial [bacterium]